EPAGVELQVGRRDLDPCAAAGRDREARLRGSRRHEAHAVAGREGRAVEERAAQHELDQGALRERLELELRGEIVARELHVEVEDPVAAARAAAALLARE